MTPVAEPDPRLRCGCDIDPGMPGGEEFRIFRCEVRATQEDGRCDGCRDDHLHVQPVDGAGPVHGVAVRDFKLGGFSVGLRAMAATPVVLDLLDP